MSDETTTQQQNEPRGIAKGFKAGTGRLRRFIIECKRVLKVTKKPSQTEFKMIVTITGIGLLIIGGVGFLIHVIKEVLL